MNKEQQDIDEFDSNETYEGGNRWENVTFSDVIEINDYPSAEKNKEYRSVGMSDLGRDKRKIQGWEYKEYTYSRPRFSNGQTLMARITPSVLPNRRKQRS
ncbi:hypothetical protein [Halovenus sp. HT40]|uniref:hypothetical protein n=1 Tax=Halovenus sp. HT40 TaxID=3126691 RepID=UPI00300EE91A